MLGDGGQAPPSPARNPCRRAILGQAVLAPLAPGGGQRPVLATLLVPPEMTRVKIAVGNAFRLKDMALHGPQRTPQAPTLTRK